MSARARGGSCSRCRGIKAIELKGKKNAPGYMIVMGLSAPENRIVSMMVLRHGTCGKRPKGAENYTCAQGTVRPLVAEDSLIFTELSLSRPESVG